MHQHTERQSLAEQIEDFSKRSGISESLEDAYGHEGDISAVLDRASRQRRLDEVCKPETD